MLTRNNMAEQLDQNVVAMMKALAQHESGNKAVLPQEKGIGGASIYQYTTSTWKATAKKFLGDENAPLNRANENKATYFRIKEWKDKGFKPAQIASMWNAGEGEPNAYTGKFSSGSPAVGVNSYGVKYNVPAHAKSVVAKFQKEIATLPKTEPTITPTPAPQPEGKKGFLSKVRSDFDERGQKILDTAGALQNKSIGKTQALFNTAGQFAGGLGDIIGRSIEAVVPESFSSGKKIQDIIDENVVSKGGIPLRDTDFGKSFNLSVDNQIKAYKEYEKKNPEDAKSIDAIFNIANLYPIGKSTNVTKNAIGKEVKYTSSLLKKTKPGAIEKIVGEIGQGTKSDIPKVKKALSSIPIENVKTYDDLVATLNNKIGYISTKLDDTLASNKEFRLLDNLGTKVKSGNQSITHNFVDDALNQLDEFYTKTNNISGKASVQQIRQKASTTGLNSKEINDIAKLHGQELNAFNASGQAASGLTKQAAENTRTGVKNTARELFDNPLFKTADEELSNLIRTRDLAEKTVEAVNKLKQRVVERGFGEKVGRLVFQVADTLTFHSLRGAVQSLIPRSAGLKILNALDLEKNLSKNLYKLQKLVAKDLSEKDIIAGLEDLLKSQEAKKPFLALPEYQSKPVIPGTTEFYKPSKSGITGIENPPGSNLILPEVIKAGGKPQTLIGQSMFSPIKPKSKIPFLSNDFRTKGYIPSDKPIIPPYKAPTTPKSLTERRLESALKEIEKSKKTKK